MESQSNAMNVGLQDTCKQQLEPSVLSCPAVVNPTTLEQKIMRQEYADTNGLNMFQLCKRPPLSCQGSYQQEMFKALLMSQLREKDLEKDLAVTKERERALTVDAICRFFNFSQG